MSNPAFWDFMMEGGDELLNTEECPHCGAVIYPPLQKTTGVNPWMNAQSASRKGNVGIVLAFCFGGFRPAGTQRYHGCKAVGLHLDQKMKWIDENKRIAKCHNCGREVEING